MNTQLNVETLAQATTDGLTSLALVIAPTMSWTFAILAEWLKAEIKKGLPTLGGA